MATYCIRYFSSAVIKHHDLNNLLKKAFYWSYGSRGARGHDGQQEHLNTHTSNSKQENSNESFETLDPSPSEPTSINPSQTVLPTCDEELKQVSLSHSNDHTHLNIYTYERILSGITVYCGRQYHNWTAYAPT